MNIRNVVLSWISTQTIIFKYLESGLGEFSVTSLVCSSYSYVCLNATRFPECRNIDPSFLPRKCHFSYVRIYEEAVDSVHSFVVWSQDHDGQPCFNE